MTSRFEFDLMNKTLAKMEGRHEPDGIVRGGHF
jgi:hypothetical protein